MYWQTSRHRLDLTSPRVMGIVNVTPDSFSDGGSFASTKAAIEHCRRLVDEGVDVLDIGGESSRPGSVPVPLETERHRVLPVLEAALTMGCAVSLDTTKPALMAEALSMGLDIVNDINSLSAPGAVEIVAAHPECGVCLMHMRGNPASMQALAVYDDVVVEVTNALASRVAALRGAGIHSQRIVLDPGIGFGKSVEHNLDLLRRQRELLRLGFPLLTGWSRKSTLGAITGRDTDGRLAASLSAALASVLNGASIVRVHDVAATVDALKILLAAGVVLPIPTNPETNQT